METVGENHRSQYRSEVKVSHQVSRPADSWYKSQQTQTQNMARQIRRQNSRPVQVITHQWPAMDQFGLSNQQQKSFRPCFGLGMASDSYNRFYQPQLTFNPGFQRFFESIKTFGPHQSAYPISDSSSPHDNPNERKQLQTKSSQKQQQKEEQYKVDLPSDQVSETSSIRSSASAYWPPELKFPSDKTEHNNTNSWKFHKPVMKLRRKQAPIRNQHYQAHQQTPVGT
mgnify:FL=1